MDLKRILKRSPYLISMFKFEICGIVLIAVKILKKLMNSTYEHMSL